MTQIFTFTQENRYTWEVITNKLNQAVWNTKETCKKNLTGFEIEIRGLKKSKSYKQLKGFHRLLGILVPYLSEWTQEYWDVDRVKNHVKQRYGYTKEFQGVTTCKSCKFATVDDMIGLIKETEKFAAEMDVKECFLENQEMKELLEYYEQR